MYIHCLSALSWRSVPDYNSSVRSLSLYVLQEGHITQQHNCGEMNFGSKFALHDSDDEEEEVREDVAPRGPLSSMSVAMDENERADEASDNGAIGAASEWGPGAQAVACSHDEPPPPPCEIGLGYGGGGIGYGGGGVSYIRGGGGRGDGGRDSRCKRRDRRAPSMPTAPSLRARGVISQAAGMMNALVCNPTSRSATAPAVTTRVPRRWTHKVCVLCVCVCRIVAYSTVTMNVMVGMLMFWCIGCFVIGVLARRY